MPTQLYAVFCNKKNTNKTHFNAKWLLKDEFTIEFFGFFCSCLAQRAWKATENPAEIRPAGLGAWLIAGKFMGVAYSWPSSGVWLIPGSRCNVINEWTLSPQQMMATFDINQDLFTLGRMFIHTRYDNIYIINQGVLKYKVKWTINTNYYFDKADQFIQ